MDARMMSRFGYRLMSLLGLIYLTHLLMKFNEVAMPNIISSYLADILCMPIVLTLALILIRYIKRKPSFLLNWKHLFFAWAYFSLAFEWYLPSINTLYTADPVDVILYAIGSLVFFAIQPQLFISFKANEKSTT